MKTKKSALTIGGGIHRIVFLPQAGREAAQKQKIVFDDENRGHLPPCVVVSRMNRL